MRFPHLSDTTFPNLGNVNVYEFQNNFDYTRWNEKTQIKLCNVIWNSDYADVVKFDTDEIRDSWFDSLTDVYTLVLETSARIVPEGYIKLPIPYDVMARYNYLFIDMPIATSTEHPIAYETSSGIRRWYFFINKIVYLSPNTTQVFIAPDVWQIYQNHVDIKYMLLERGHAPVYASDVDEYLANPIANNRYLLAPDVTFDNAGINRDVTNVPFGNGTKYVCIASTCAPDQIASLGVVYQDSTYDPFSTLTYSDSSARYGHQLIVSGYTTGNGRNYAHANTPAKVGHSNNNRIPNNLSVYAIEATECYGNGTFFSDIIASCPQFLNTVQACFVVDSGCITLGTSYTLAGHTIYRCIGKARNLLTKHLTKADFNYPNNLKKYAKLYTSPYAQLEITDNDGNTYTINIEETTTLNVKSVVSVAFPYINERVYIEGIGGSGSQNYTWTDLAGNLETLGMSNSDWFKYCFDWQIPTFTLFMDGGTAYQLATFNRNIKQGINDALVAYHNTMRSANTAYENACDTADVANTNANATSTMSKENADLSADTGKENADASAGTGKANAYNSADTAKTNADNAADTNKTNSDNQAQTAYDCIDRSCTCQTNNQTLKNTATTTAINYETAVGSSICYYGQQKASNATYFANQLCQYTTSEEIRKSTSTMAASNISTMVGSAATGAVTSSVAGTIVGGGIGAAVGSVVPGIGTLSVGALGAIGGAVIGLVTGGVQAAMNEVTCGTACDVAQSVADAQQNYNSNTTSASNGFAASIQNELNALKTDTNNNVTVPTETSQVANITSTSRTNAADLKYTTNTNAQNINNTEKTNATNTQTTAKNNADNTYTTSVDNASRTKNTAKANAQNTYNVSVANATRTKDNVKANAGYTRQVEELNAKELLENAARNNMAGVFDARNSEPKQIGFVSGNAAPDYNRTRGLQIKVKTQSDSAIRQAGDIFVRYGYALNQIWDVATSGLKLMRHFTYWKATEIWVDDREASNNTVQTFIQRMFLNGVTVWNSPTEIGLVNVYDN